MVSRRREGTLAFRGFPMFEKVRNSSAICETCQHMLCVRWLLHPTNRRVGCLFHDTRYRPTSSQLSQPVAEHDRRYTEEVVASIHVEQEHLPRGREAAHRLWPPPFVLRPSSTIWDLSSFTSPLHSSDINFYAMLHSFHQCVTTFTAHLLGLNVSCVLEYRENT